MRIGAACLKASPCGWISIWAERRQSHTSAAAHVSSISWSIIIPRPSISNGKGRGALIGIVSPQTARLFFRPVEDGVTSPLLINDTILLPRPRIALAVSTKIGKKRRMRGGAQSALLAPKPDCGVEVRFTTFSTNADPPTLVGGLCAHKQLESDLRHAQSSNHLTQRLATFSRYSWRRSGNFRRDHDIRSVRCEHAQPGIVPARDGERCGVKGCPMFDRQGRRLRLAGVFRFPRVPSGSGHDVNGLSGHECGIGRIRL